MSEQIERMGRGSGFIAALDQSGGSTPKALQLYGIDATAYSSDDEMFDTVHAMRTRIVTDARFTGTHVLGAILFQNTLDREVLGQPTSQYLWREKQIVPFLKVDYGMHDVADGVQLMKPIPDLDERLVRAKTLDVFGTKMRSVIKEANGPGIAKVVTQQFDYGRNILAHGLVPIIEPEVDINAADKRDCEDLLRDSLREQLAKLDGELPVIFKLTLPETDNFYQEFTNHPKVLRVVALSGGYSREESNEKLANNQQVIASFSRALTEGLHAEQSADDFSAMLGSTVESIAAASAT
ncbi:MAG: fructose bisphosphate aldolase [Pseudomonadales bacterium]|nr:fructose bisphosphate aldolase [Pseudomonadales bacterium]